MRAKEITISRMVSGIVAVCIVGVAAGAAVQMMLSPDADAASAQPQDERKAQQALPMARDPLWATLMTSKISYSDREPHISAEIAPEVRALSGKPMTISGFVLPMDAAEKTTHFLLSKRTPTCEFCPPGEPNEVLEVYSKTPVEWTADLLTMQGRFELVNNTEQGIFYVLKDAVPVATPKGAAGAALTPSQSQPI